MRWQKSSLDPCHFNSTHNLAGTIIIAEISLETVKPTAEECSQELTEIRPHCLHCPPSTLYTHRTSGATCHTQRRKIGPASDLDYVVRAERELRSPLLIRELGPKAAGLNVVLVEGIMIHFLGPVPVPSWSFGQFSHDLNLI